MMVNNLYFVTLLVIEQRYDAVKLSVSPKY